MIEKCRNPSVSHSCRCEDLCRYDDGSGHPTMPLGHLFPSAPRGSIGPADPHNENKARGVSTDSAARKEAPVFSGVMKYFPKALAAVARLSKIGNDKHNPGEPLHWSRGKSDDHGDCIARHQLEAGTIDTDGRLHDEKVAWRALAQLEIAIEKLHADGVDY